MDMIAVQGMFPAAQPDAKCLSRLGHRLHWWLFWMEGPTLRVLTYDTQTATPLLEDPFLSPTQFPQPGPSSLVSCLSWLELCLPCQEHWVVSEAQVA